MVTKDAQIPVVEDDEESELVNENGKRLGDTVNKDGKKRLKTKSLYRQPTVNELNRLQETETLFNSNLFRLQVDEVLQEVKIKEKTEKKWNQFFTELKTHLLSIPEDNTEYDLTEQKLSKKIKLKIPILNELQKTKCVFQFHKFKDIEVVGSFYLGCPINSKLRIDLQITVPADTYTKNDSVNYRYDRKRAAYLAIIAAHLKKLETIEEVTYTCLNGCLTKPVLDIKPTGKLSNYFTVRIDLACDEEAYKLHRFSPSRNNLRESWLLSDDNSENTPEVGPPTPYYNSSILKDLTSNTNHALLKDILLKSENLKQAIVLLKIWLRQRQLQVSGHVVSMFVVYLVQNKRINNIMSSYQIVRNVWISLKTLEWDKKGISLHKGTNTPSIEEFHQHFPVVFVDCTGYYNITWQMSIGTYNALKRESTLAIEILDNGHVNSFIPLFMVPVQPLLQFDHILKFKNLSGLKESVMKKASKESRVNYGLDQLALTTDVIHSLLVKGLSNRVNLILPIVEADLSWNVKKTMEGSTVGHQEKLSFGLILDPENALIVVEKGPAANLPESEEFRAFWGDKSELRRFQDGSITEACVWQGDTVSERRGVTRQIIDYLLTLKYGIKPTEVFHICDQLDSAITRKQYACDLEESSAKAIAAFDELRRDMRALVDLPLDVSAVYGTSPVFSYCDPVAPLAKGPALRPRRKHNACLVKDAATGGYTMPEYVPVCKAVVELGHSGKWPGDLQAFRCLKAAFNLQIAEQLSKQFSLPTQAYPTHIDVLKNGLVFRLEIAHPKEITLLRREIQNGVVKYRDTEESLNLITETVLLPRLRGALHGLYQKYPSFGPASSLLLRWFSSHLLPLPPLLSSLLTSHVYLNSYPMTPPSQPTVGFIRTLKMLAETDWGTEIIVLDFNGDLTREQISEIEKKASSRDVNELPLYIATSIDAPHEPRWAVGIAHAFRRAVVLARTAVRYLQHELMDNCNDNVMPSFVPSLSGYDAIIHLNPSLVPYYSERIDKKAKLNPLPDKLVEDMIPVVEFNPVARYLDELRNAYSDYGMFFHDSFGGDIIAVLWKPDIGEPREFQVSTINATAPIKVNGEVRYKVNTAAIIEDFRILGQGLVTDITVNYSLCSISV